jgi:hypothetical protein
MKLSMRAATGPARMALGSEAAQADRDRRRHGIRIVRTWSLRLMNPPEMGWLFPGKIEESRDWFEGIE